MATIQLEVVSPDKQVCDREIAMLIVRSTAGELGILPRHAPLVTGLIPHVMRIKTGNGAEEDLMVIGGGFMEVTPEKITVLASAAEDPKDIDVARAQAAYQRAKQRIDAYKTAPKDSASIDIDRAQLALARAMARLAATKNPIS